MLDATLRQTKRTAQRERRSRLNALLSGVSVWVNPVFPAQRQRPSKSDTVKQDCLSVRLLDRLRC